VPENDMVCSVIIVNINNLHPHFIALCQSFAGVELHIHFLGRLSDRVSFSILVLRCCYVYVLIYIVYLAHSGLGLPFC